MDGSFSWIEADPIICLYRCWSNTSGSPPLFTGGGKRATRVATRSLASSREWSGDVGAEATPPSATQRPTPSARHVQCRRGRGPQRWRAFAPSLKGADCSCGACGCRLRFGQVEQVEQWVAWRCRLGPDAFAPKLKGSGGERFASGCECHRDAQTRGHAQAGRNAH